MNPAQTIAMALQTAGVGLAGSDIFVGPVRPASAQVPAKAIFILGTGGPAGARTHTDGEVRYPTVQVRIRDNSLVAGIDRAEAVYQALANRKIPGFLDCEGIQSAPMYLEQDENLLYHWSINFELMRGGK